MIGGGTPLEETEMTRAGMIVTASHQAEGRALWSLLKSMGSTISILSDLQKKMVKTILDTHHEDDYRNIDPGNEGESDDEEPIHFFVPGENINAAVLVEYITQYVDRTAKITSSLHPTLGYDICISHRQSANDMGRTRPALVSMF